MRKCTRCGKYKSDSDFTAHIGKRLNDACRDCNDYSSRHVRFGASRCPTALEVISKPRHYRPVREDANVARRAEQSRQYLHRACGDDGYIHMTGQGHTCDKALSWIGNLEQFAKLCASRGYDPQAYDMVQIDADD